jgi:leader peptidase (prepilin peptidase) / N-methyltransferase
MRDAVCALAGATAAGVVVARVDGWAAVPFTVLAVVGALLAWIDLREHRLPNAVVLPSIGVGALALGLVALAQAEPGRWLWALAGGGALFALYLLLSLPGGMGMGDVKLAALVGLFAGWLGFEAWLLAALGGFVLGGGAAALLIATRRGSRGTRIPFGPWMLAGLAAAVAVG